LLNGSAFVAYHISGIYACSGRGGNRFWNKRYRYFFILEFLQGKRQIVRMKNIFLLCIVASSVSLMLIVIVSCQMSNNATTTGVEPRPSPPIIYTPVPPPPTSTSNTVPIPTSSPTAYTLAISVNPSGSGTVTPAPAGGDYPSNTVVTLTAVPAPGYQFDHWSGNVSGISTTVTLNMDSNKSIVAYFK
jgi:hypothetical protein